MQCPKRLQFLVMVMNFDTSNFSYSFYRILHSSCIYNFQSTGAVKYFDLRRNPTSNYKFSYDEMLDTRGNTAIYLLYAHARLESICTKGSVDFNVNVEELMKDTSTNKIVLNFLTFRKSLRLILSINR
jgi:arginyl-tRNA synthetase